MTKQIVYGARCVWWDSIDKVGSTGGEHPLPACPHCGGVLYQMDEADWWAAVDKHEADGHPGYRKKVEWLRGKCFPNADATAAYEKRDEPPEIALTIDVLYSCKGCGLRRVAVKVPARGDEDVVKWLLGTAMPRLSADHKRRSFICRSEVCDLMIPVTGAVRVGDAPNN